MAVLPLRPTVHCLRKPLPFKLYNSFDSETALDGGYSWITFMEGQIKSNNKNPT